ncbi:MAG: SLC13 family permease [Treponema sp.]|nr:SLC13 family permease [Treponema sp.]
MDPIIITLILLAFAVVMFVTEKIPLALTSMIVCVGFILTGVLTPAQGFAGFVNANVILFVGMFIIGGALFDTGMANEIGGLITKFKFVKTERQVIIAVMLVSAVMSTFLSNTGTAAVLIPVIVGISAKTGIPRSKLLMSMLFIIIVAGNNSLIGAPGNLIAHAALEEATGRGFAFFEYGLVGFPLTIIAMLYMALFGYKLLPSRVPTAETFEQASDDYSHVPSWKRWLSLGLLLGTVFVMVFERQIGIPLHVASSIGAILLVLTRVISEKQAYKAIDLKVIFLFGGTLAIGAALERSGAGAVIAGAVIGLLGEHAHPLALLAAILVIAGGLTQFMSNTATTALLVPVSMAIAQAMQADPSAAMAATVIGGSLAFTTPIAMPANTMIFAVGGFKFTDYVKAGLPMLILMMIMSFILLPIFFPFF